MKRIVGPKPSSRFSHHGHAARERLGVDDDALRLEQVRERLRVGERRDLGLEARSRPSSPRSSSAFLNVPWIAVPFEVIETTSPLLHLVEEERAVRDADARGRLHRARADPEVDDEQHGEEHGQPPAEAEARRGASPPASARARGLGRPGVLTRALSARGRGSARATLSLSRSRFSGVAAALPARAAASHRLVDQLAPLRARRDLARLRDQPSCPRRSARGRSRAGSPCGPSGSPPGRCP